MSTIAEMARAEADETEAHEAEAAEAGELDENETTVAPEVEDEPEASVGEAEIRKAEKAIEAQRRKLAGILGDGAVAHECLFCTGLGFVPELPPLGALAQVVDEGGPALAWSAPGQPPADLLQAADKATCDACNGYGEQVTGSRNPHALTAPCGKCNGNGWMGVIPPSQGYTIPPVTTGPGGIPPAPSAPLIPPDAWDRPQGHPHYGIPPSMVGA